MIWLVTNCTSTAFRPPMSGRCTAGTSCSRFGNIQVILPVRCCLKQLQTEALTYALWHAALFHFAEQSIDVVEQHIDTHFVPPLAPPQLQVCHHDTWLPQSAGIPSINWCVPAGAVKCMPDRSGASWLHISIQRLQCPRRLQRRLDCARALRSTSALRVCCQLRGVGGSAPAPRACTGRYPRL
eukprot:SAG11_NODE_180_length_13278_cov_9.158434_12_plen_183_part_00